MAYYIFKVVVEGKGKLWNVKFHPENDFQLEIPFSRTTDFKKWTSDEFEMDIESEFDYFLVVGGPRSTEFELKVQIKQVDSWRDFITGVEGTVGEGCDQGARNKGCLEGSRQIPPDFIPELPIS